MFGPYRLKRLLGRGGMGEVYEAEHTVKEWPCAVKLMSEPFSNHPVFRERMRREARNAGRLHEPHVVPIHEYGEIDGQMFMEMRLIDGADLGSMLKRYGPLTPPRAVAIITQIASALDAAHAATVTHRDVKPANILVSGDDFAYLVDFGIANAATDERLTDLGLQVGTRKYMAPEQLSGDKVTYSVDVYALACVLHEALTGAPPRTKDPIPKPSAVRPGIPKAFDAVVARGMAKRPEDRYPSAGDLAIAAREALTDTDQHRADTILRRSQEATLPDTAPTKRQAPPSPKVITPAPTPVQNSPTPTPTAATSGPSSGPISKPPQPGQPWGPASGPIPAAGPPAPAYYQRGSPNWGTPPPGTPPPQQLTGPTPWNQPPKPKRNPWAIVAGAAAVVVVLVLAAIGISLTMGGGDNDHGGHHPTTTTSSSTTSTMTTTTTTQNTPTSDAQSRLLSTLPAGYPNGTCVPTTPKPNSIWANTLAMVDCGQNTDQGGPSRAVYGLFANADVLSTAFNDDIHTNGVQLMNCPGSGPSPDTWHHNKTPTVNVGMIACATYNNHTNLIWSNQAKLVLSDVFGDPPAIADLYKWWTSAYHSG
jgi:serine/threonine-protein kinase